MTGTGVDDACIEEIPLVQYHKTREQETRLASSGLALRPVTPNRLTAHGFRGADWLVTFIPCSYEIATHSAHRRPRPRIAAAAVIVAAAEQRHSRRHSNHRPHHHCHRSCGHADRRSAAQV